MPKEIKKTTSPQCVKNAVMRWLKSFSVIRIYKFSPKYRLIIRNFWSDNFNGWFIIKIAMETQGLSLNVYQFGLFNFCLCLIVDEDWEADA